MMGFGMMGGGFFGLLIVGALIYFIVSGTNQHHYNPQHKGSNALDLLKERYAKGEISDEEFERKKRMLDR